MPRSPQFLTAFAAFILAFMMLVLCGCTEQREVIGQAYVAPQTLTVRSQISLKSGSVATVKHGDKVGIVDVQRRLVKVLTAGGAEGWVDSADLLSVAQMDQIRKEREADRALPSEGEAKAYEVLNVHLEPTRKSPAIAQINEGIAVAMLARTMAPKNALPMKSSPLVVEKRPPPSRRSKREQQAKSNFRLPPRPPPPKPPANWQELSAERVDAVQTPKQMADEKKKLEAAAKTAKKAEEDKKPVVIEDWTLVRTKAGDIGWVLTRNLLISIPDDVAQYAEGKKITSYFELGTVNDEVKGLKHHWLWTTLGGKETQDFDSWRVFYWNSRKHRFETSHRQRDLAGYFPVLVDPAQQGVKGRTFHLIAKDDDGKFRKRSYSFDGALVHLIGTEDYDISAGGAAGKPGGLDTGKLQAKAPSRDGSGATGLI